MKTVVVGTRRSGLAKTQTMQLIESLKEKNPEVNFEVKEIVTKGDRIVDRQLSKVGGKGKNPIIEPARLIVNGTLNSLKTSVSPSSIISPK